MATATVGDGRKANGSCGNRTTLVEIKKVMVLPCGSSRNVMGLGNIPRGLQEAALTTTTSQQVSLELELVVWWLENSPVTQQEVVSASTLQEIPQWAGSEKLLNLLPEGSAQEKSFSCSCSSVPSE
jgi:hypothetical protein